MNTEILIKELTFKATRSSGAGGQHVNKVSTKIVLTFDLLDSEGINTDEKELLLINLKTKSKYKIPIHKPYPDAINLLLV